MCPRLQPTDRMPMGVWQGDAGARVHGWAVNGHHIRKPDYIPVAWMDRIKPEWGPDREGNMRWHLIWTGWNNGKGHAKFTLDGRPTYCYRWIIEQVTGYILRRFDYVDHLCERKACLTLECLDVVSPRVNTERGPGKGFWFKPHAP